MNELVSCFTGILDVLQLSDYLFLLVVLVLLILTVVLIDSLKKADNTLEWENTSKTKESNDIMEIVESLQKCDERLNIDLTDYEKGEEEASIISYEELLKHNFNKKVNYEEEYNYDDVSVKKIGIVECEEPEEIILKEPIMTLNYEKEEALLSALKQLQSNLSKSH